MGTNYYWIPNKKKLKEKKNILKKIIDESDDLNILYKIDSELSDIRVHLGKKSFGWIFLFNLNNKKFYSNKEELLKFIYSGTIYNEYGDHIEHGEFINISFGRLEKDKSHLPDLYSTQIIDDLEFFDEYFK